MTSLILVVEDNREWQDSYSEWFALKKHEVKIAETKNEALNLISQYTFTVAIVDINLSVSHGNQDGLEFVRILRQRQPETKIVVVSGSVTPEIASELQEIGLDYIPRSELRYKEFVGFVQQKIDDYNAKR
jgi:CheY-like chemotaxis protein